MLSLEPLLTHLYQQYGGGGLQGEDALSPGGGDPGGPSPLWRQLATVHCGGAGALLAMSWTQQLDGILTSAADGTLAMWQLQPVGAVQQEEGTGADGGAAHGQVPADASLRVAWSARVSHPQGVIAAGLTVHSPSASASTGSSSSSSSRGGGSSSSRQEAAEPDRSVSVWWPQPSAAQQAQAQRRKGAAQQRAAPRLAAAGSGPTPAVGREKLRHPCPVTALHWSPGVLSRDALGPPDPATAATSAGSGAEGAEGGGSDAAAAAAAAAESEDHPALMTVGEDGLIRIWVVR